MKTPHHIRRPGSRRPPARRALSPASGPRQSRSSCKHHPGKILDHETQTDGEESGQRLPPVSSSTRTAGHAEDGRPPGGASPSSKAIYAHRVDYFGPLEVTVGRRREKRWAALFTCLTTRAVHMEVASSLSADSMIMALRRFMARRGQPDTLYSDHGTNFVAQPQNSPELAWR
ncbi:hypothetical protein EVAR_65633_1 [Eumeta japonica]|uniref:Integrase catalytic domain-containing protein n=1 Tax=Eumeta variegata TaxID=151549 RepID=A0A4C1ZAA2_EUMVA|nr:hypothetical protein EVAR_65633_1 [Eumeta japonica]